MRRHGRGKWGHPRADIYCWQINEVFSQNIMFNQQEKIRPPVRVFYAGKFKTHTYTYIPESTATIASVTFNLYSILYLIRCCSNMLTSQKNTKHLGHLGVTVLNVQIRRKSFKICAFRTAYACHRIGPTHFIVSQIVTITWEYQPAINRLHHLVQYYQYKELYG